MRSLFPKWLMRCIWRAAIINPIVAVVLVAALAGLAISTNDPITQIGAGESTGQIINGVACMVGFITMFVGGLIISMLTSAVKFTAADRHSLDWTERSWGGSCIMLLYLLSAAVWAIPWSGALFGKWSPFVVVPCLILAHLVTVFAFALIYGKSDLDDFFERQDKNSTVVVLNNNCPSSL